MLKESNNTTEVSLMYQSIKWLVKLVSVESVLCSQFSQYNRPTHCFIYKQWRAVLFNQASLGLEKAFIAFSILEVSGFF